jgi:hypothetical protein
VHLWSLVKFANKDEAVLPSQDSAACMKSTILVLFNRLTWWTDVPELESRMVEWRIWFWLIEGSSDSEVLYSAIVRTLERKVQL